MGQQAEHPAVRMLASVDERLLKLGSALGIGPASRRRLTGRLEVERKRPQLASVVVDLYAEAEAS
jgi:phage terminase small subunit